MYQKTVIMLIFFMPSYFFAMEPAAEDEQCLLLPTIPLQVFDLVANYVTRHTTVRSVATTSKFYKKRMCATAAGKAILLRDLYLKDCAKNIQGYHVTTVPLGAFTLNYGTARCDVFYRPNSDLLIMREFRLKDNSNIDQKKKKFPGFTWPLQHYPKPFFTKEGLLCFHGYGKIGMSGSDFSLMRDLAIGLPMGVIRYDFNGNALQCCLSYKNGKKRGSCSLMLLRGHIALMCAILNSKKVRLREVYNSFFPGEKESVVYYHLSGVTVPDDYSQKPIVDEILGSGFAVALYNADYTRAVNQAIAQKHKEQQWGYTAE